jgi:hypothetical protein
MSSIFYESAVVPERLDRAAIFSACRLELLLLRPTFGGEFVSLPTVPVSRIPFRVHSILWPLVLMRNRTRGPKLWLSS